MTPESPREPDSDTILRKEKLARTVLWNLRKKIFNVTYRTNEVEQATTFCEYDAAGNRRKCLFPSENDILNHVTVEEKTYSQSGRVNLTVSVRIPFVGHREWVEYWITTDSYDDPVPEHPFTGPSPLPADSARSKTGIAYLDEVLQSRKENERVIAFAKNAAVYIAIAAVTIGGIYAVLKAHGRLDRQDIARPVKTPLPQRKYPTPFPTPTARPNTSPLSIPGSDPTMFLAEDDRLSDPETRVRTFSLLPSEEFPEPQSKTDLPR